MKLVTKYFKDSSSVLPYPPNSLHYIRGEMQVADKTW